MCGLLTGCGSEPGSEQGDEKVPNLPKEICFANGGFAVV